MLLYNWRKIVRHAGLSSKRVLNIFEAINTTYNPNDLRDPLYKYQQLDFSGHSFIVNPIPIIKYRYKWRDKDLADYIGLASFRNLGEYKFTGKITLDLTLSPMGEDKINQNKLLRIIDGEIHFLYEDYKENIYE